jgi:hypothetical protein
VPELNLLEYLSADHQNLLEAAPASRVLDVSQHLSVERDFLYAAISHHVDTGKAIVEDLRNRERRLEECLRDVEKDATSEHRERLQAAIGDHVTFQEELFARLRGLIPESALLTPSEVIALSIGGGPTHAHPRLAEGGLIGAVVEDVTSAADHARDRLHHKRDAGGGKGG